MSTVTSGLLIRRDLQRLSRNGSSTAVTVSKPVMRHLGWLPGQTVIVEVHDDNSLHVRLPNDSDYGPRVERSRSLPIPVPVKP